MPQISQLAETYGSQLFWLLITFALVYFVIGRMMATKVVGNVERRDQSVAADLAAAEGARRSADQAEEEWRVRENEAREQARRKLAEARAAGARATEQRLAAANAKLDAKIGEADARIAASREAALGEIDSLAASAAQDIVARIAGTDVDAGSARKAVEGVRHGR